MSIDLITALWKRDLSPLSAADQAVLVAMADHGRADGTRIYVSLERVAWKIGRDRSNVRRAVVRLREAGVLKVVKHAAQHRPVEYRIVIDKLGPKPPFREGAHAPSEPTQGGRNCLARGGETASPGGAPTPPEPLKEPSGETTPPPRPPSGRGGRRRMGVGERYYARAPGPDDPTPENWNINRARKRKAEERERQASEGDKRPDSSARTAA